MKPVTSAGLLLFRRAPGLQVLLGHMGGPYWARKDEGAWSIPKGEYGPDEDPFSAARREFAEEMGSAAPDTTWYDLGSIAVSGVKVVTVWAGEAGFDAGSAVGNTFEMQWPPRSGTMRTFAEIDRADWFATDLARRKLVPAQGGFIDRLLDVLAQQT